MSDRNPAWLAADYEGPTPSLEELLKEYERDDNVFWRLEAGHHQNLLETAVNQLAEARTERDDYRDPLRATDRSWRDLAAKRNRLAAARLIGDGTGRQR